MSEIICPKCKTAFTVDESGYAEILKQVHDKEFNKQLKERLELAELDKQKAIELAEQKIITTKNCRDAKNLASARIHTWPLNA